MTQRVKKQELLDALYAPYKKCTMCPLGTLGRTKVVFGSGNPDANVVFIGEGPGEQEDVQGLPFVGKSGQLLTRIMEAVNINRTHVYITNIVKCRPPNNRKPLPNESKTCKDLLLNHQIEIIQPKLVCTLGSAALEGLLGHQVSITKIRGVIQQITIGSYTVDVLPTFHPAYILRNPKALPTMAADLALAKLYISK